MSLPALTIEQAQARMLALLAPMPAEAVPVERALGRYLAQPLVAARTQPPADLSAMDGYAVAGTGPWQRLGESRCGEPFGGPIAAGQCVRISTGAILPLGADRVLIQEDALVAGAQVSATVDPAAGKHIRRKGFEFAPGALLLPAGPWIGPAQLALVRSAGHATVPVHAAPTVAVFDSGDELTSDPTSCAVHQIPASNGAMLGAMASSLPCTVRQGAPLPDRLDAIVAALEDHADADLLVLTGGASVGVHDLARPALEAVGAELDFWKVAMKPGKPLMVARRGRQVVIGLPGNPVSAFVTGFLFMLPALRRLLGAAECLPQTVSIPLATDCAPGGPRRELLRGSLRPDGVMPSREQDSSALLSLARSDVLIDRPAHADEAKAGTPVPVYLLGNG
ncbi:molybdopterin molybdotransferase MoeA [Altererythrobacter sp. H2]|uniref:molybdopterin molybdotransferase MoeA n=1 Tax=Altererythrobacter sp. H2 TaxID=3108391 RepID=UPI002B4C1736|nr:molybdopterin molybdotransferase MoeA [Altererythrobacter sp. H2]WRK94369.1 molybdopterin molybdotransferase MoeA [Altererythrobacter sp. H2]